METDALVFRHLDDVVFENRNKTYGAYLLRRAYVQRLLSGLGITVAIVALILSLQNIFSDGEIPVNIMPPLTGGGIKLTDPPVIRKNDPPRNMMREPKTNTKNRPVLVTTDEVMEETEVNLVEEYISGDGSETGIVGIPEGTGTMTVIETAPVVMPEFVDIAEVMPRYEGGLEAMMKFIQKKIRYPSAPKRLNIDGTVYVRFVVKGDGSIVNVEVIRGVHPDYDKEAMRVISMLPAWKGGSQNGRPISVRMVLPIKFNLQQ